ncbi:MAG: hypothetical protein JRJ86_10090 [Deltaproteobacteria bacterium]|nr:hypothetical protein [Deltaproteobacteria bacterium]MBW2342621.1 hypothetical protein [Deltaproteobacteria bacterium]
MKKERIINIIQKRLGLEDSEFQAIKNNPRFQRLFDNAVEASRYRLFAEGIESKGCHSGHTPGQKIIIDSTGNLLTRESPERVCDFLLPNLLLVVNAFFENLMNGRDPNEVIFNRTGCFDVGPACGGWGHVVMEMTAVKTSG